MSEVLLSCQTDKQTITVGDHINLSCNGSLPADFSIDKAQFKTTEQAKYLYKLFKIVVNQNGTKDIDLTFYHPAQYKIGDLVITDGISEIKLTGSEIKVESVIKPSEDGKPPEPFGFLMPISMSTPYLYYLIFLIILVSAAVYSFYRARRYSFYQKLKKGLVQYQSPIDPDTQFYKAIRVAEKTSYPMDKIEHAFRLYNLRAYQLPMFDLSNEKIQKYFRRNFPEYKTSRMALMKLLDEIEVIKNQSSVQSMSEKKEFIKKLYRYVETNKGLSL